MGDGIGFTIRGGDEFGKAVDTLIERAEEAALAFVTEGGHIIEAAAKERSPVLTGTLRRSIGVFDITALGTGRFVSSTAPRTVYGRRIELGFHGDDSLGRHYNQGGRPYLTPALAESLEALEGLHERLIRDALEV